MWCCAQTVFNEIENVNSKRVKMLKDALKPIDRFWSKLTVCQTDKLCFFVVIVFIQSRSFFVWESLFKANAISICITFISFFVWCFLFKLEILSFKSTSIQRGFHSCDHSYSKQWLFRVTIFILSSTKIIVDKSCFIYREYVLKKFSVETDLKFSIVLSGKDHLNKQFAQLLLK